MRVPLRIGLAVALLVAVSVSASWAGIETYLPGGAQIQMKLTNYDVGSLYTGVTPGTEYLNPGDPRFGDAGTGDLTTLGKTAAPFGFGEDGWGIFRISEIDDLAQTDALWRDGDGGFEITGIFWGLTDESLKRTGTTDTIKGNGMHVAFFQDSYTAATRFNATAGASGRTGAAPTYATATDGTLIWSTNSVLGVAEADPYEFISNYTPGNGIVGDPQRYDSGEGTFGTEMGAVPFWGTGSLNSLFEDLKFTFTATGNTGLTYKTGATPWLLRSNDPVEGVVTPELSSAPLMLLGMLPIGVAWWRRRKA
jgi:hypothetical protein